MKKLGAPNVPGITDAELLRPRVLKYLIELMDETPPLGERYEELLRGLVFQAYEVANGDLGPNEQAFLSEIFEYATRPSGAQHRADDARRLELVETNDGRTALFVYSAIDRLHEFYRPDAPWALLTIEDLQRAHDDEPYDLVFLDMRPRPADGGAS